MKVKSLIFLAMFTFFVSFQVVNAQLTPENAIKDLAESLSIKINPENPGPNETVTINIESYSTDLNQANITWTVQGKVLNKGIGEKGISFVTGPLGSNTNIVIQVSPIDGKPFTKTVSLTISSVDLLWHALSYTPSFYRGRSVMAHQGSLVFLAMPNILNKNGAPFDPKQMVYTWTKNGSVLGSLSGYGKNTLYVDNSFLDQPLTIEVSVTSSKNSSVAKNSVYIESIEPKILLYEKSPLYGIFYNNAFSSEFKLLNKEITIVGSPYYFSQRDFGSAIKYNWSLNNDLVPATNKNYITLRKAEGSGSSLLGLKIDNSNKLLQTAEKQASIIFGDQNNI